MSAQDHPEPVEPPMTSVPGGIYCLVHGVMDCTEPFCWRCANHEMDDLERCADPRCRASNDQDARAVVESIRSFWASFDPPRPAPVELIAYKIGQMYASLGPSSLPVEPGGGGREATASATGAGSVKPMAAELPAIDSTRRIL